MCGSVDCLLPCFVYKTELSGVSEAGLVEGMRRGSQHANVAQLKVSTKKNDPDNILSLNRLASE